MTDPITRLNAALEGRYRIERELGQGGMATVYLADDLRHERKVAVKVLKPELAAVVGAERFLAEIKTTANLQHPHILPLHDSGEADGFLFFVMPYVAGDALSDKIDREKQLSIEESVRIASDVAEALDHAHRQGIVHRDIKPGNILLTDGRPVVADFGIALAVAQAGGGRITETGLSVGTPHYMSPEQATGDRDVDPRTDIYALGCVLYEMLVGEPPYTGSTAQAVLARILTDSAPAPTKTRLSIPPNVDAAIRKALEKLPADRFTTAQEFAKALTDPVFRHGEAPFASVGPYVGPWRGAAIVAGILAILSTAGLAWALLGGASRANPASPERVSIVLPSDQRLFEGNQTSAVVISPNGENVVYMREEPGTQYGLTLWVRSLGSTSVRQLPGTEGAAGEPFFSPDGQWVGFFTLDQELKKVSLSGGNPVTLVDDFSDAAWAHGAWTDDDTIVYNMDGMYRVSADGGTPELLVQVDAARGERFVRYAEYVPESGAILFAVGLSGGSFQIEALTLETGERRVVMENAAVPHYLASGHLLFRRGDQQSLLIVPFDGRSLTATGSPFPLIDDVRLDGFNSIVPQLDVSRTGTLAYVSPASSAEGTLGLLTREGEFEAFGSVLPPVGLPVPRVSPDGRYVAFDVSPEIQESEVRIHDLVRGTTNTYNKEGQEYAVTWHPDGGRFSVYVARDSMRGIVLTDLSGEEQPILIRDDAPPDGRPGSLTTPDWSPDAELLAYTTGSPPLHDVWIVPVGDGGGPQPFLDSPASEHSPAFSPDGRWLAYVSDESGRQEVYIRAYPEGETLTVSTNGGVGPMWSPSGDEIFFQGLDAEGVGRLWAVAVEAEGETISLGEPTPLVERSVQGPGVEYEYAESNNVGARFDVLPDGRFVIARTTVPDSREIVLVQNFFESLREVVGD